MKLWLISQRANSDYDTYDSAVVAAETEDEARNTNPANGQPMLYWSKPSGSTWLRKKGDVWLFCPVRSDPRWNDDEYEKVTSLYRQVEAHEWCGSPEEVAVELLGEAVAGTLRGVICASFNAG
jgi:alkanesulfonate monooxygenase SsuD/methylene tetrahydromethanopterin reductase-like flavin-dependent oxidoreductase (luciferase family)